MILSVIIVNYNVKYFLEQCLYSVEKALSEWERRASPDAGPSLADPGASPAGPSQPGSPHAAPPPDPSPAGLGASPAAQTEILVVDNDSPDGSVEYLQPKFPRVRFIANRDNAGFSRANNQGLTQAAGKYILFLNPDTILPEDYFSIGVAFLESMPAAGALGVRMIDGGGRFLKESRRGFPSPWVAFCKLTGLTTLFPRSKWLAGYYLGHFPDDGNHPAPVLSGACMLARRAALDQTGGFDERFFMYAEDIDLSYRIGQAGYTNYYIADTTILHFKGESTQKDARYVRLFYKAMSQFRRKHFTSPLSTLFNALVEIAVRIRVGMAALLHPSAPGQAPASTHTPAPIQKIAGYRTRVTGDPAAVAQLTARRFLPGDRILVANGQPANEIIFCEGAAFSFKSCIEALEQEPGQMVCKIHAAGSSSAVGSYSKEGKGETMVL